MNLYIIVAIAIIILVIIIVMIIPTREKAKREYDFVLGTKKKDLHFYDPFDNFLVYGGANSGKTKSIGKPLIGEYIRNGFAGFIYDYKDIDLTKTASHFVNEYDYPYSFYRINFIELSKSHRTNPISPKVITDENLFIQLINDLFNSYMVGQPNEWSNGALSMFKGVAINFYYKYPHICTIPHIVNFICSANPEQLTNFLNLTHQSRLLGSVYLSATSENTKSSYLSTLNNYLSPLAINKNIAYILSGNDFDFNLIDPQDPKLVCVCNSYQIESALSPIISLMLTASSRRFTFENDIPFFYGLDEATTFKITDFEKMPSVLREYKCSFLFLTQSGAKIEKLYSKLDRSSIESNFGNQFFGKTKDIEALKVYTQLFGKHEVKRISKSKGASTTGTSQSTTTSQQKEERYDINFFTNLQAGEFIGSAAKCNVKDFHVQFNLYQEQEDELNIIRTVLPSDIENNYNQIVLEITNL